MTNVTHKCCPILYLIGYSLPMSNSHLIPNPMNFSITIRGSLSEQKAYYVVCHEHFGDELYDLITRQNVKRIWLNGVKIIDQSFSDVHNTVEIHGDKDSSHLYGENGQPLPCKICKENLADGYTRYSNEFAEDYLK